MEKGQDTTTELQQLAAQQGQNVVEIKPQDVIAELKAVIGTLHEQNAILRTQLRNAKGEK